MRLIILAVIAAGFLLEAGSTSSKSPIAGTPECQQVQAANPVAKLFVPVCSFHKDFKDAD